MHWFCLTYYLEMCLTTFHTSIQIPFLTINSVKNVENHCWTMWVRVDIILIIKILLLLVNCDTYKYFGFLNRVMIVIRCIAWDICLAFFWSYVWVQTLQRKCDWEYKKACHMMQTNVHLPCDAFEIDTGSWSLTLNTAVKCVDVEFTAKSSIHVC